MVAKRCVTSAVLALMRAEACAASQPAWPPPTTMTSKKFMAAFIARIRGAVKTFHVNQRGAKPGRAVSHETAGINFSFTNTEVLEDLAQHVLDADLPGDARERIRRAAQLFCEQFLAHRDFRLR